MSRELHVVSHSHWDREWHQTFQQFRLQLVGLIDRALQMLRDDVNFRHFMLDGQTIMLEDYLEMRPERADELREHIASGGLLIGPWYVHPDEFLVSGEAIVRNLLQGLSLCRRWDNRMAVGYVPDQFGHIAQLPQIWAGFGIASCVLWRGVDHSRARLAFTWRGHDGSAVLAVSLPDGYNQAEHLPLGAQALAARLAALAARLELLAEPEQPLLLMHGGDHSLPEPGFGTALLNAREWLGDTYAVRHSTLPSYIAALRAATVAPPVITGELRSSRSAFLLPAVLSSRMWIKQRNAAAQTLLERQAEPLAVMAEALGTPYPRAELGLSWRYLLQNHPHDSICGCGIDQVHKEMSTRFDWSEQIATAIRDQAMAALAARVDSLLAGAEDPRTLAITIFNGAPTEQTGIATLTLRLAGETASYDLVDATGRPVAHQWSGEQGEAPTVVEMPIAEAPDLATMMSQVEGNRVMGFGILEVAMRTLGQAIHVDLTIGDQALLTRDEIEQALRDAAALVADAGCTKLVATIHHNAEHHLSMLVPAVPACGYTTLLLRPRRGVHEIEPPETTSAPPYTIANERYAVDADPETGKLTITERASGARMTPASWYVDGGEAGDLYTHSAPAEDLLTTAVEPPLITRAVGPLGESLSIEQVLHVPPHLVASRAERAGAMVALPIETRVTLLPGDQLVRFQVRVRNAADDHRLRAHFTLPFLADHAHAESAFALVRRAAQPGIEDGWAEQPTGIAPHLGMVALHGAGLSCILAARGLPEYEVLPGETTSDLALTLLRCTGWLSRSDIPERPGDAGPPLPTPEAQCHGTHHFSYALAFGAAPWRDLVPAARAFAVDLKASAAPCAEGFLPPRASFVTISPHDVVLSALKGAEDGRGAILRLYNAGPITHRAMVDLLWPVRRVTQVRLDEQDEQEVVDGEPRTHLEIDLPAGRIISLRFEWADRH